LFRVSLVGKFDWHLLIAPWVERQVLSFQAPLSFEHDV
jgi:hypothetical protein